VDTNVSETYTLSIFRDIHNGTKVVLNYLAQFLVKTVAKQPFHVILCATFDLRESHFQLNKTFQFCQTDLMKPDSSVSIVFGYGLDCRAIEVRSPAQAKGLFL
jgi:hypothetical protein